MSQPERAAGAIECHRLFLPDVDALDALPLEALPGTIAELAALQARAASRLHVAAVALREVPTVDRLLTIDEAAARLSTTKDWLRRQSRLSFVVHMSPGQTRYSEKALERFIAARVSRKR